MVQRDTSAQVRMSPAGHLVSSQGIWNWEVLVFLWVNWPILRGWELGERHFPPTQGLGEQQELV